MKLHGLDSYRDKFNEMPGWMHLQDLEMFDLMLDHQLNNNVTGDILEIGAYKGKSAIALGFGLRMDEQLVVNDIWDGEFDVPSEGIDDYGDLGVVDFGVNYRHWHDHEPAIMACSSWHLKERLCGRLFRFIHIDGGHAYQVALDDIYLAKRHTGNSGVVVVDDYRSSHTPGVAAAVWQASFQGVLYPFALSEVKLYAATSLEDCIYWSVACQNFGLSWSKHSIFGFNVLRIGG